jgi:hypothetical protein
MAPPERDVPSDCNGYAPARNNLRLSYVLT